MPRVGGGALVKHRVLCLLAGCRKPEGATMPWPDDITLSGDHVTLEPLRPDHLGEGQARLRVGLQAKKRQLGGDFEVLVWECAYEQWHRLLFARFLIENGLLRDPEFGAPG